MPDIKLNRKRSYGIVYGSSEVKFVQDGLSFSNDGTLIEVGPPGTPTPQVINAPVVPPEVAEEALAADRNRRRAEAMRRMWAARKEAKK